MSKLMTRFLLCLCLCFVTWAEPAPAQTGVTATEFQKPPNQEFERQRVEIRYGVLDIDRVIAQSVAYVDFKSRWDKVDAKYQKEIEFYESQLLLLDKQIKATQVQTEQTVKLKQKAVLYEAKVQELMQKRKEKSEQSFDTAFGIMRQNIDKLVYEYAKSNNLNVIFSRAQVMYFSDEVDITSYILKNLNATLPKIDVAL
jgi:Skp family chaperone for outer membrane proteins